MDDVSRRPIVWLTAITGGALLWSALLVLSPGWQSLRGREVAAGPRRLASGLTYLVGARLCHQRPERSFHLHGRSLPVCGRCTGLYLSGTAGLLAGALVRRRRSPRRPSAWRVAPGLDAPALWLAAAALPTVLTWSLEVLGLWNPGTRLRALAALPLGLTAGLVLTSRRGGS